MSETREAYEDSWALNTRVSVDEHDSGAWRDGVIATPWGYVVVYSQSDASTYRFIHRGRVWYRSENRSRTARGLGLIARSFAKRVASRGTPA